MKKILSILAACLTTALIFTGCDWGANSNPGTGGSSSGSIVGQWGSTVNFGTTNFKYHYTYDQLEYTIWGTYSISGNTLTLNAEKAIQAQLGGSDKAFSDVTDTTSGSVGYYTMGATTPSYASYGTYEETVIITYVLNADGTLTLNFGTNSGEYFGYDSKTPVTVSKSE